MTIINIVLEIAFTIIFSVIFTFFTIGVRLLIIFSFLFFFSLKSLYIYLLLYKDVFIYLNYSGIIIDLVLTTERLLPPVAASLLNYLALKNFDILFPWFMIFIILSRKEFCDILIYFLLNFSWVFNIIIIYRRILSKNPGNILLLYFSFINILEDLNLSLVFIRFFFFNFLIFFFFL
jgi:hypothetical protein